MSNRVVSTLLLLTLRVKFALQTGHSYEKVISMPVHSSGSSGVTGTALPLMAVIFPMHGSHK